jgi:hypothetical protein
MKNISRYKMLPHRSPEYRVACNNFPNIYKKRCDLNLAATK